MFTKAIVRPPAENYVHGITTSTLGAPDLERALHQHAAYCSALEACGLSSLDKKQRNAASEPPE